VSLFEELKRRNVIRVGVFYVVASWLVLQVAELLFDVLGVPEWSLKFVLAMVVLGFPIVLIFSWVYELTPEGIRREKDVDRSASITGQTGHKLNIATLIVVALGVAIVVLDRFLPGQETADIVADAPAESPAEKPPAPAASAEPRDEAPAAPLGVDPKSVAVLPFVNMSGDPENEYFSDGLSEELLNTLAGIRGLYVAARTSSFHFKGHTGDIAEIAKKLRVANVLEGSVRQAGDKVRITAQLIEARNGYHLWSATFDRTLDDVFAVQDEIARSVGEALKVALLDESARPREKPTDNTEAYLAFLRGKQDMNIGGGDGYRSAIGHFEDAIRLDPEFTLAYAQLAMAWARLADWGIIGWAQGAEEIRGALARAGEGLGDDPLFLALTGIERYARDRSGERGLDYVGPLKEATERSPDDIVIIEWYAYALGRAGQDEEQIRQLRRAVDRDPLSVRAHAALGYALESENRLAEARAVARTIMEISPESPEGPDLMANVADREGRYAETVQWLARVAALDPDDAWSRAWIAWEYAAMGDLDRAEAWADAAVAIDPDSPLTIQARALVAYRRDDLETAGRIAWAALEAGVDNRGGAIDRLGSVAATVAIRSGDTRRVLDMAKARWADALDPEVPAETVPQAYWRSIAARALAAEGEDAKARMLAEPLPGFQAQGVASWLVAPMKAFLGDAAGAVDALGADDARNLQAYAWVRFRDVAWDTIRDSEPARRFEQAWEAAAARELEALRSSGKEPPLPGT
jgi:TolB-like protein/Flp pilus assembly protein TadD